MEDFVFTGEGQEQHAACALHLATRMMRTNKHVVTASRLSNTIRVNYNRCFSSGTHVLAGVDSAFPRTALIIWEDGINEVILG